MMLALSFRVLWTLRLVDRQSGPSELPLPFSLRRSGYSASVVLVGPPSPKRAQRAEAPVLPDCSHAIPADLFKSGGIDAAYIVLPRHEVVPRQPKPIHLESGHS